jgi:hypothetical protein
VHAPRPPSIDHGVISFIWAVFFGLFIWVGLLAIGVNGGVAVAIAVVSAFLIFLFVRVYGEKEVRPK